MLWFKNAIVYQLNKDDHLTKENVEKALQSHPFIPCGSQDSTKFGWVSPFGDSQDVNLFEIQGHMLLKAKKETKLLPSSVVKQALQAKVEKLENAQSRKLKKIEKDSLKDEVMIDLLPRAFSKYNYYWLWIDTKNKRVIADSGSHKQAEDLLALLRKGLGTLALTPLHYDTPLEQIMTTWVQKQQIHPPFILGDEAELKDPLEGNGIIRCKNQEVTSEEILSHIEAGKQITKLKLYEEEKLNFMLHHDITIKRIKYETTLLDQNEDIGKDEREKRLEADFLLMSQALSSTLNNLLSVIEKVAKNT
ncbi:recombination-associated protein RdgC [Zophobihabitans entericus]|uniref:Recombination-associated protein RdgC n=1 Tax=Zophobihabitans entericus TaxID=1635327 RepID=A0A6G9IEU7_9GAMM|nr:recombination-associated protein RdgC [Zophobihabitans entericus]QIQ22329.1 recombination-associated protein RdgC [Zophobihabitans entericus]